MSSLRDDLLRIDGVESVDLDDEVSPRSVRVRLATGADAERAGLEIRGVLAAHGLRSEVGPSGSLAEEAPAPVPFPARNEVGRPAPRTATVAVAVAELLARVAVEEGRDGVRVRAETTTGRAATRRARPDARRVDEAIVAAVADLVDPSGSEPTVLTIVDGELMGTPVVTVLLERGRRRAVGSAATEGGRAYAIGRAAWAALTAE